AGYKRRLIASTAACAQQDISAGIGDLHVIASVWQTSSAGMRRAAIQIDIAFTRVDVQIDATTDAICGEDRAGQRLSLKVSASGEEDCERCGCRQACRAPGGIC